MDIFAAVKAGTLTSGQLTAYLRQGGTVNDCDGRGPCYSLLSTAIRAGQAGTVKLLLDHDADPSLPSGNGCYPLWIAANARKNRAEIVQMLLDKRVDPDRTSDDCDNDTPLMVAITQARDCKVISLLVDARASLDKPNNDGQTARQLAQESGDARIVAAIESKENRPLSRPELINAIVTLIVFILSYINSGVIQGVVKGVVSSLYHITKDVPQDTEVAREIAQPKTVDDFKQNINTYVEDSGLGQFFSGNKEFLQTVAEKAVELKQDPTNLLTEEDQIRDLTTLALYQTIIFGDDSRSMGNEGGKRLESQRELITRMAKIATTLVPDGTGVELNFINNDIREHQLDEAGIQRVLEGLHLRSGTMIGTRLHEKVLQRHIYNKLDNGEILDRPFLILIITDGWPTNEPEETLKEEIVKCMRRVATAGYEPEAVLFGISQIGDEDKAKAFLAGLKSDTGLDRVLYVTTKQMDDQFAKLRENEKNLESWLLQVIMSPITRRGGL